SHQRNAEKGPNGVAGAPRNVREFVEDRLEILDVDGATFGDDTAGDQRATDRTRLGGRRKGPMRRGKLQDVAISEQYFHVLGLAQPCRVAHRDIENGPNVRWRGADDAEDLGRRRLLLLRFCQAL